MSRSVVPLVSTLALFAATGLAAQTPHYHVVKRLELGRARADYIIIDPAGRRLYGLADKVIDVDRDTVIGTVAGVPTGGGARTCAVDEKTHKVYVFYYQGTTRDNQQLVLAVLAP